MRGRPSLDHGHGPCGLRLEICLQVARPSRAGARRAGNRADPWPTRKGAGGGRGTRTGPDRTVGRPQGAWA